MKGPTQTRIKLRKNIRIRSHFGEIAQKEPLASEVGDKIRSLRDLAREVCSVLLVCHNRKAEGEHGDEISGSNAFTSNVDGWLSIQSKDELPNDDIRLSYQKNGRALLGHGTVVMDTHTLHFREVTPEELALQNEAMDGEKRNIQFHSQYQEISTAIQTLGGKATTTQLCASLKLSQPTITRHIKEMVANRDLTDTGERVKEDGKPGKGAVVYALTSTNRSNSFIHHPLETRMNELDIQGQESDLLNFDDDQSSCARSDLRCFTE